MGDDQNSAFIQVAILTTEVKNLSAIIHEQVTLTRNWEGSMRVWQNTIEARLNQIVTDIQGFGYRLSGFDTAEQEMRVQIEKLRERVTSLESLETTRDVRGRFLVEGWKLVAALGGALLAIGQAIRLLHDGHVFF